MFIVAKRNVLIPNADGSMVYPVSRGYIGTVPAWVENTDYFKGLVKDGKISVTESYKDKDLEKAEETEIVDRKRKPRTKKED